VQSELPQYRSGLVDIATQAWPLMPGHLQPRTLVSTILWRCCPSPSTDRIPTAGSPARWSGRRSGPRLGHLLLVGVLQGLPVGGGQGRPVLSATAADEVATGGPLSSSKPGGICTACPVTPRDGGPSHRFSSLR
jgi:hypothetical protein